MRIIQLTDCHITADPNFQLKGICTRATLERVLRYVRERHGAADYLIVTGDLTHDEQLSTYKVLRELLAPWIGRLRVIPGNHDDRASMRQLFPECYEHVPGRNMFVDRVNGWKLMGLDTHIPGAVAGELGEQQLSWLHEQLDADRNLFTCLFMHHPPVKLSIPWLDEISLKDMDRFLELLNYHSHVRLIGCGHVHMERTVHSHSSIIVTTSSTGVQFRPDTLVLEVDNIAAGLRIIQLEGDGNVSTWVERVE